MALQTTTSGRRAELRAARLLRRRGYRILARNVRAGRGEIDILARIDSLLVIVEVRYRKEGTLAADVSVSRAKEMRIRSAWRTLRTTLALPINTPVRFDLILVGPSGPPVHITDVWGE